MPQKQRFKISSKELSLCHKHCFSNPYILETQCRTSQIFQIMKIKYTEFEISKVYTIRLQRHKGIRKFEFVAKTQFLWGRSKSSFPVWRFHHNQGSNKVWWRLTWSRSLHDPTWTRIDMSSVYPACCWPCLVYIQQVANPV